MSSGQLDQLRGPPRVGKSDRKWQVSEQLLVSLDEQPESVLINRGSFGTVYKQYFNGAPVAVKVLHPIFILDSQSAGHTRFMDEMAWFSRLSHPNVVQFIGLTSPRYGDVPGIVMEFMICTLRERYGMYPGLAAVEQIMIAYSVCSGLSYLHSRKLLHRDLTTSNIMFDGVDSLNAKIADVGCAHHLMDGQVQSALTASPGHQNYMAPETRDFGASLAEYEYPSDCFSFGVCLLAMCTAQEPPSVGSLAQHGHTENLKRLTIDHPLYDVIKSCLQDAPRLRPSARLLLSELREVRHELCADAMASMETPRHSMATPQFSSGISSNAAEQSLRNHITALCAEIEQLKALKAGAENTAHSARSDVEEERQKYYQQLKRTEDKLKAEKVKANTVRANYEVLLRQVEHAGVQCNSNQCRSLPSRETIRIQPSGPNHKSFTFGAKGSISNFQRSQSSENSAQQQVINDLLGMVTEVTQQVNELRQSKANAELQVLEICESLSKAEDRLLSCDEQRVQHSIHEERQRIREDASIQVQQAHRQATALEQDRDAKCKEIAKLQEDVKVATSRAEIAEHEIVQAHAARDQVIEEKDRLVSTLLSRVYEVAPPRVQRSVPAAYFLLGAGIGQQRLEDMDSLPKWAVKGQLPAEMVNRCNQPCLHGDYIFVGGARKGSDELELYRAPLSNLSKWESLPLPSGRWNYHAYFLSAQGMLWMIVTDVGRTAPHRIYRNRGGASSQWELVTCMPLRRTAFGACVRGSLLMIVGGCCGSQYGRDDPVLTPEAYDTGRGEWLQYPCLPQYSKSATLVTFESSLHVIGGHGYVENNHQAVLSLNLMGPSSGHHWTADTLPAVPFRRCGACVVNNQLIVAGGQTPDRQTTSNTAFLYDRSTGHWRDLPPLQRQQFASRILSNGRMVICLGGFDSDRQFSHTIEVLEL